MPNNFFCIFWNLKKNKQIKCKPLTVALLLKNGVYKHKDTDA